VQYRVTTKLREFFFSPDLRQPQLDQNTELRHLCRETVATRDLLGLRLPQLGKKKGQATCCSRYKAKMKKNQVAAAATRKNWGKLWRKKLE